MRRGSAAMSNSSSTGRVAALAIGSITALLASGCVPAPAPAADAPAARGIVSPLAGLELAPRTAPPFAFVVCGHVYGAPGAGKARPAATFAGNVARLRATSPDLVMLLGDCVFEWREAELARLHALAADELRLPVFNAPGNHDLADPADYERRFGPRRFAFDHGGCRMVVVDTESEPWHVGGEQLQWLLGELAAAQRARPRALFVFGHKPVWAVTRRHAVAALGGNDPQGLAVVLAARAPQQPTFRRDLLPALRRTAAVVPVWWFAGDVGAFPTSLHLYHARDDEQADLRFVAVGLGDLPRDAFVRVDVPAQGPPRVTAWALATGGGLDVEPLGPEHWTRTLFPDGLPAAARAIVDGW
jgi:hypothetical protein